ncbi:hypothetical protein [Winogradskyella pacifica]|uniref:hypothetical protein n=1 Tax=Winogradskyella pacifica TaxID=664642 RepID=UPI0015C8F2A4|nr:hypothetical protein [Winogradskyella pacifica]
MFKFLILFTVLSFTISTMAQTGVDLGLNKKKKFISIKSLNKAEKERIEDFFITDNDTLVNLKNDLTEAELKLFCECYTNDTIIKKYKEAVFQYSWSRNKKLKIRQWNAEIKVYFDSAIPKDVKKEFIAFYKPLNEVKNLKIDFVKNKDASNYVIKTSDTIISQFGADESDYKETHPLKRISYNIATDNTYKFYSAITLIDLNRLEDKSLLLQKLKQVFFISLGQFVVNERADETSLLSTRYKNSSTISKMDITLLKMHYLKIFDQAISAYVINELVKKSKTLCTDE